MHLLPCQLSPDKPINDISTILITVSGCKNRIPCTRQTRNIAEPGNPFSIVMNTSNPFLNDESDHSDEDLVDQTKALKEIWVGIANSTDKNLKVATWTFCSLPNSTPGERE